VIYYRTENGKVVIRLEPDGRGDLSLTGGRPMRISVELEQDDSFVSPLIAILRRDGHLVVEPEIAEVRISMIRVPMRAVQIEQCCRSLRVKAMLPRSRDGQLPGRRRAPPDPRLSRASPRAPTTGARFPL
jgi:hypothetical protein